MRTLFVAIGVWVSANCSAQLRFSSPQDLLSYADKHAPAARLASLQPEISRQDVNLQASGLYPKINVFGSGDYYPIIATQVIPAEVLGGQKGTYLKAQFGLPYIFTSGAELTMPVVNLEKWAQLQKSKAQHRQAQWSGKLSVENLHLQLIQAYYQHLVARAMAALNQENLATADELMRIMSKRKEAGVLNPADFNRSANLQLDTRSAAANYEKSLQQSLNALHALLGLSADTQIMISDSIDSFLWPGDLVSAGIESRPAWQEAAAREQVARLALKESRQGALPKLNLNGRYAYNMQSKLEAGSNNVEFDVSNISLRAELPLFQGNYYRSLRKKNELLLQSASIERERTAALLDEQQRNWTTQYRTAYSRQEVLRQKLSASADNLRIARLSLEEAVMEFDEFNNIFMEYSRARMEYIQNQADGVLYYLLSTQNF